MMLHDFTSNKWDSTSTTNEGVSNQSWYLTMKIYPFTSNNGDLTITNRIDPPNPWDSVLTQPTNDWHSQPAIRIKPPRKHLFDKNKSSHKCQFNTI